MLVRPRDLAVRISDEQPEKFRLPVDAARRKAREVIDQIPQNGLTSIVENWRPVPIGNLIRLARETESRNASVL
jgi:hypothetical protein